MKTLHDYLTESKKSYNFAIKIAGPVPEDFQDKIKSKLEKYKVSSFVYNSTTPIQAQPLDFPNKQNCEVHVYNVACSYPVIPPQIAAEIMECGIYESDIRVHNADDPTLAYLPGDNTTGPTAITDSKREQIKAKDYFGDAHVTSFLKDIAKVAKERKKEGQNVEYKLPKQKEDKLGMNSAIGGK